MKSYLKLNKEELQNQLSSLMAEYEKEKAKNLNLDMSRGKPNPSQLDLSMDMLKLDPAKITKSNKGTDVRNYGILDGVDEAKEIFSSILGVGFNNVIIGGASSLNLMYDMISKAMLFGVYGGKKPWGVQGKVKFLCPCPGYDRHFAICEAFGIEMINVPMTPEGPDMDEVEKLISSDEQIKGIWCVPKYSNPQGITYSDAVVKRFANLKPKADDFRIFWDNAYLVHNFEEDSNELLNIFDACKDVGSEDLVYEFFSTSKITFSGSGIAVFACSDNNRSFILKQLGYQTIGYDKINQLRHARFFENKQGVINHMKKHAAIIKPKFDCVCDMLEKEIAPLEIGSWFKPKGGYFVGFDSLPGCAKRIYGLCKDAGVTLTTVGATFPYGKDPKDQNIRIAPTFPPVEELEMAMKLFCLCTKIASAEMLLSK